MKKVDLTGEEIIEILLKTGTKEWNESISTRLESVRSFLDHDEWTKGISPFLRAVMGNGIAKLLSENCQPDAYNYTRGFIAGLRMVTSLPTSIEAQIQQADAKSKSGKPDETSGY